MLWLLALGMPALSAPPPGELDRELETTPAQRAALQRVADAAWQDLDALALPEAQKLAAKVVGVLTSDKIDQIALETARREAVQLLDRTTAELLPRAIEAAEILTPAQRRKAAELVQEEAARWMRYGAAPGV